MAESYHLEKYEEQPAYIGDSDWKAFQEARGLLKGQRQPLDAPEYDLNALSHPVSKFPPEVKIAAVAAWVATGNYKRAAKLIGLRKQILVTWRNHAVWWDDAVARCRQIKTEELDGVLSNILDQSTNELGNRLSSGEPYVVTEKFKNEEGEWETEYVEKRRPISTKDLLMIANSSFEKRALLRGDPTTRKTTSSSDIAALATMLKDAAKEAVGKSVVSEQ